MSRASAVGALGCATDKQAPQAGREVQMRAPLADQGSRGERRGPARSGRRYDGWRSRVRTLQIDALAYRVRPGRGSGRPRLAGDPRQELPGTGHEDQPEGGDRPLAPAGLPPARPGPARAWIVRTTAFADRSRPAGAAVADLPDAAVTATVALVYPAVGVVAFRPRSWRARGALLVEDPLSG